MGQNLVRPERCGKFTIGAAPAKIAAKKAPASP